MGKTNLATVESKLMAERPDFMGDKERGQEGVGIEDITIPRIDVIQSLSPQRKKNDPSYIKGAEEGALFNNVTGELYGESVVFVPVFFKKEYIIWKDVKLGGGFNGSFNTENEARIEFGQRGFKESDYEIVATNNHFGLILHDSGEMEQVLISMAKSKNKVSRKWNTLIKMAGGDRFSRAYRLSAVSDSNAAGQDYFNFGVDPLGFVDEATFKHAEKMYEAVSSGERKAAPLASSKEEDDLDM